MSFNRAGSRSKEYDRVSLEEFSDDDSNDGNNDFVQSSIKNQQVRSQYLVRYAMLSHV